MDIFNNVFLYSPNADDTTFFVSDEDSAIEVMDAFDKFSLLSGLKPNKTKCEIVDIDALKGVSVALYGVDCIDLTKKQ